MIQKHPYCRRSPSTLRAFLWSGPFVEGWAVYAEGVMKDAGYLNGDPLFALTVLKMRLRSITNTLLDIGIHTEGMTRKSLGLTGDEVVSIEGLEGDLKPLSLVPCHIQYADGTTKTIQIKCRIDTEIEIEYVEHGGVLHYVLRDLATA